MTIRILAGLIVALAFANPMPLRAQNIGDLVSPPPTFGTFFSMQNPDWPPLPWCPFDVPVYFLGTNELGYLGYAYDDREITYGPGGNYSQYSVDPPPIPGGDEGNGPDPGVPAIAFGPYGSNDLWLEIVAPSNNLAPLILHGTRPGHWYQVDKRNQVNQTNWAFGQVIYNATGTNRLYFDPVPVLAAPKRFFRGVEGYPVVGVTGGGGEAIEPSGTNFSGQTVDFTIFVSDVLTSNLVVNYVMSGSAQNGVDYASLTGSVTVPPNQGQVFLTVHPYQDSLIEFTETVKLTLVRTNGYLVDPDNAAFTYPLTDWYPTNLFTVVATNLNSPSGIDYHPVTNALIVSVGWPNGEPNNFVRIAADGGVTNWSGIHGLAEEIKLAIVKTTTGGFTAGDIISAPGSTARWQSSPPTGSYRT